MKDIIEPKVLRGFRDFLPPTELLRKKIRNILEGVFHSFGFVPIDTPALEYAEILLGKGGGETDKQIYRFLDQGKRDVALRFDLTVPFARFMARHAGRLPLPFKRYHIGKAWRGENTQRGRYREFTQIDFDTVGVDSASADLEILQLMQSSFAALGIDGFRIHYSHRGLLRDYLGVMASPEQLALTMPILDRVRKIGEERTKEMLQEVAGDDIASKILDFMNFQAYDEDIFDKISKLAGPESPAIHRLRQIREGLEALGLSPYFRLDTTIVRGLDYYTGLTFETFLKDLPDIGSVCSGGRYNNLASLYTKQKLPGVGASLGLDRLVAAMEELKLGEQEAPGCDLIILYLDDALLGDYHRMAARLRGKGLKVEVYPEKKKLAAQFNYAGRRNIPLAIIYGQDERARGSLTLKDLRRRQSHEHLSLEKAAEIASELLRS